MPPEQWSDRLTSKPFPVGFDDPMYMIVNLAMGAKYFKGVESTWESSGIDPLRKNRSCPSPGRKRKTGHAIASCTKVRTHNELPRY
jgi:hypothetical protein